MKTIDKSNNLPIEIVFKEIMQIYSTISVLAPLDLKTTSKQKLNLRIILFITSGILLLCTLIMSIIDATQLLPVIKPFMFIANIFLILTCLLMYVSTLLYERKLKKELQAVTGVSVKDLNSYVSFYTKCSDIKIEKLELCKEYCDLLIAKNSNGSMQNISSYILWYALPFLINILSSSIGSDFTKNTTIINIVNSLLWGIIGVMVYNLINVIKDKENHKINAFNLHVQYCILNKKSKT